MKIYASMATYPGHHHTVERAVASLKPQVDKVFVCCNEQHPNHAFTPEGRADKLKNAFYHSPLHKLGDAGKFDALRREAYDGVWLICDDDLLYPPDYAERVVEALERYDFKAAVSFHGARLILPIQTYRSSRVQYSCLLTVERDVVAHVLGTGTLGFHSSLFFPPLSMSDFPLKNMADLWFARVLQRRRIPAIIAAHRGRENRHRGPWIESLLEPGDPSIWKNGELPETTELVRRIDWQLHEPHTTAP